ncbi:PrsW family intramembrane metalloprotease [Candidatus Peregrinibacteria bacterium]|nr:MAG: PrsW family intramembrane metalloprotease [Candidatus Peregrinibacteria bacterium]
MGFTQEELIQIAIMVGLAALPALIWSYVIFKGRRTSRGPLLLAFFLGTLTVVPLILLYDYLWVWFPDLDVYRVISENIGEAHIAALITLLVVGILEEWVKSGVVRTIDKTKIGIQTINDAVKYSILAGLGFAFTENIFYFYGIWQASGNVGEFLFPVIFRSIFTVCGHMVFSGIFGYFYGIAKFAKPILETNLYLGEKNRSIYILSKILGTDEASAFKQWTQLKGLLIAMAIHTAFNFALEFSQFLPVILIVGLGFAYLLYLLAHKAGNIVFSASGSSASMAKRDVDVVLELLGMWSREGRHKDVVDICQRLLMRDPDNKVVQLFQAKAMDKQKLDNLENSFSSLFKTQDAQMEDTSMRALIKQKVLIEMLKEKQAPQSTPAVTPLPPPPSNGPKIPTIPKPR